MSDNEVVSLDPAPDQLKKLGEVLAEITRQFVEGLHNPDKGLSLEQGQMFVEHRAFPENVGISPYVSVPVLNTELFIADWQEFYRQVHSMKMTPSFDRLPPPVPGFNWGVWVPEGMTPQRAFEMGEAMYTSWKWCDDRSLDEVMDFTKEVCSYKRQRIVWCEDSVEPPLRLANLSALHIVERGINTLTLIEVELLHQWFFWKSGGKHLDTLNATRCDGSRCYDGTVPCVKSIESSIGSELHVYWCGSNDTAGHQRPRRAIS